MQRQLSKMLKVFQVELFPRFVMQKKKNDLIYHFEKTILCHLIYRTILSLGLR